MFCMHIIKKKKTDTKLILLVFFLKPNKSTISENFALQDLWQSKLELKNSHFIPYSHD